MKDRQKRLPDDTSDKLILYDLQRLLAKELAKPSEERDYDAVEEITAAIAEISDVSQIPEPPAERILSEVKARKRRENIQFFRKWTAAVAICFVMGIAMNVFTLITFGIDLGSVVYKAAKSGFTLDLSVEELPDALPGGSFDTTTNAPADTTMTTGTTSVDPSFPVASASATTTCNPSSGDGTGAPHATTAMSTTVPADTTKPGVTTTTTSSLGDHDTTSTVTTTKMLSPPDLCDENSRYFAETILDKCDEYGIEPCYPQKMYVPEGFEQMTLTDSYYERMSDSEDIYFTFENSTAKIDIILEKYDSRELMPQVLIPSDVYVVSSVSNEYFKVYIFSEGTHDTAVFVYDNIAYTIYAYNISPEFIRDFAAGFGPFRTASPNTESGGGN